MGAGIVRVNQLDGTRIPPHGAQRSRVDGKAGVRGSLPDKALGARKQTAGMAVAPQSKHQHKGLALSAAHLPAGVDVKDMQESAAQFRFFAREPSGVPSSTS